jgi:hypothetical protein
MRILYRGRHPDPDRIRRAAGPEIFIRAYQRFVWVMDNFQNSAATPERPGAVRKFIKFDNFFL